MAQRARSDRQARHCARRGRWAQKRARLSRNVSSAGTLEGKQEPFNEGSKRFPFGSGTFERDLEDQNRQQHDASIGFHYDMQTRFDRVVDTGDVAKTIDRRPCTRWAGSRRRPLCASRVHADARGSPVNRAKNGATPTPNHPFFPSAQSQSHQPVIRT
jgi:hypothetical protein